MAHVSLSIEEIKEKLKTSVFINEASKCWEWFHVKDKNGYGKVFWKKHWRAHRLSYFLFVNQNLADGIVCHKCDNPSCINPDHLFVGTWLSNMQDKVSKGRLRNQHMGKKNCKHGHEFTDENTIKNGNRRICRNCYESRWKKRNAKIITPIEKEKIRESGVGTFCKNGHEFVSSNTLVFKNGTRRCRYCENEYQMKRKKDLLSCAGQSDD